MEALQSSSFIKRDPIICCCGWAGGIHCMIVQHCVSKEGTFLTPLKYTDDQNYTHKPG